MKTIAKPKSAISAAVLDQLLAGYEKREDLTGDGTQVGANVDLFRVLGLGANVDLGSMRSTFGFAEGALGINSVFSLGVGWSVAVGIPGTNFSYSATRTTGIAANVASPNTWYDTSSASDNFVGIDVGVALGLGAQGRIGYVVVEGDRCPGD